MILETYRFPVNSFFKREHFAFLIKTGSWLDKLGEGLCGGLMKHALDSVKNWAQGGDKLWLETFMVPMLDAAVSHQKLGESCRDNDKPDH